MPRFWPTARYVTYSLTKDGGTPTLLFEMFADSSARLKSTSRRKIIGQVIDTIIAHVTSGHCHALGSDQRCTPGPDSVRPSSGICHRKSSTNVSPPRVTYRNAGMK